jgi:Tfp pilus assembly protein PilV
MKNKAFSLVEILIAAVILIIVLGGLLHLFNHCLTLSTQSANIVTATAEGYSKLEEIRLHEYDDIVADYNGNVFALQQLNGNCLVNAAYVDETNQNLLQVTVTVNYIEKANRAATLTLTTLIAKRS